MPSFDTSNPIFISGPTNAEDIVRLPGAPWVIASHWNMDVTSGMPPTRYGFGPLKAIRIDTHEVHTLYPSSESVIDWDRKTYPDCPEPPQNLSTHGLHVRALEENVFRLYVANHGDRHSVEIIDVTVDGERLRTAWRGCVVISLEEQGIWPNGVAPLPEDGFIVSGFNVAKWRPGRGWEKFPSYVGKKPGEPTSADPNGPGMSNGVEVSPDGRWIFIADSVHRSVIRIPFEGGEQKAIKVDFIADNLKWGEDGLLYVAGMTLPKFATREDGWKFFKQTRAITSIHALAIDPETLAVREVLNSPDGFGGRHGMTSTALQIGDELWMSSEKGDRIAVLRAAHP